MLQTGPRNLADCFIRSLPGFSNIGTLACHREYSAACSNELALLICIDASAEHGCTGNRLRVVETVDDVSAAHIARVALSRADNGYRCAIVECWRRAELTSGGRGEELDQQCRPSRV